jgi:hypothetical protein
LLTAGRTFLLSFLENNTDNNDNNNNNNKPSSVVNNTSGNHHFDSSLLHLYHFPPLLAPFAGSLPVRHE